MAHQGNPPATNPAAPQRILIVRPSALGDVSRTVPALVTLRKAHPQARIDWLVQDSFAPAIAHHPALSRVIQFPRHRFGQWYNPAAMAELLAWLARLNRARYDLVFDLQGLLRSGIFTRITVSPRRVGFADAREKGYLGYNRRHVVHPALHAVDRMLALLEAEGYTLEHDMRLYVGAEDERWWTDYRAQQGGGDEPYACLAPTARWRCKCWPIEKYTQVAQRLLEEGIVRRVVLLASKAERAQVQPMLDALSAKSRQAVLFPQTTVGQMMAVLARAAIVLCNDSAALHIAVGFDRPIVAIFGPTDPARVGPYRRPDAVVQPAGIAPADMQRYRQMSDDQSLIARVEVEQVWRKIEPESLRA